MDIIEAAVLHDLGKCMISPTILNKREKLQAYEFEYLKTHTTIGFDLSRKIPGIKQEVREVILTHHERNDGRGYPFGLNAGQINIYTKIVSVADVYDALTSERVYKKRKTPFETFKEFQKIGFDHFDPKVVLTFLTNIINYYLGSKVLLNTGETGEVVFISPYDPSLPTVKVAEKFIDLTKEKEVIIEQMI
jgi:HD-GYP domain-containing protein (c-di-GMP phosphodiesterase class II)